MNIFQQKQKGFTLLEVLLVVAAIGVLASVVIVAINPQKQLGKARDAERQSEISTIYDAIQQYSIDNGGEFPSDVEDMDTNTYTEICDTEASGVDSTTCDTEGYIDLSSLVPTYVANIPRDPQASDSDAKTGYLIGKNSKGTRVTIKSSRNEESSEEIRSGKDIATDSTPDNYAFTDKSGVETDTQITSDSVTISGINTDATVSITDSGHDTGEYRINGGTWKQTNDKVKDGDTIELRLTSASDTGTTRSATLDVGGVTDTWDVTTESSADYVVTGQEDSAVSRIYPNGLRSKWTESNHSDEVNKVAVDSSGNVYTASSDDTVRKLDSSGNEVWSFGGHSRNVTDVAVDSSGNVYTASIDNTVRKLDSSGSEVWSFGGHSRSVYGVAVDSDGNVYTASSDDTVKKLNSNGNEVWTFRGHSSLVNDVAVDSSGNVYSVSWDDTVRKIDSEGDEIWSFTGHSDDINGVTVDGGQNIYTASDDNTVRKVDATGTEQWSFTGHSNPVNDVAVDEAGNVYTAAGDSFDGTGDPLVRRLDETGSEVWSFTKHTEGVNGIGVNSQ